MKLLIGEDGSITAWDQYNPKIPECAICNGVMPHTKSELGFWEMSYENVKSHSKCIRYIYRSSGVCN